MKRHLTTMLLVFGLWLCPRAQVWVTIPDPNFVTELHNVVGICMNGNQLDISCQWVTSVIYMQWPITNRNISDLTGIQYFLHVQYLDLSGNNLSSLPPLSPDLVKLNLSHNQFTTAPTLQAPLAWLDMSHNQLTALPTLPSTLTSLYVGYNAIPTYPGLPSTLEELGVDGNNLSTLPPLPNSLHLLLCGDNPLGALPALPPALDTLGCQNTLLTGMPALPSTLRWLDISDNNIGPLATAWPPLLLNLKCNNDQMSSMASLPSSLVTLACSSNALTTLPTLPSTLTDLDLSGNLFSTLPTLPAGLQNLNAEANLLTFVSGLSANLQDVNLANNQITCFGTFPQSATLTIDASGNPLTCIPNYPHAMTPSVGTIPICTPGNPNSCLNGEGIGGKLYEDIDANCVFGGPDLGYANAPVKVYDNAGAFVQSGNTYAGGDYFYNLGPGQWSVRVDTLGKPYTAICAQPGVDSTNVLSLGSPLVLGVDFDLDCKPGFDVGTAGIGIDGLLRPGQTFNARVLAGDLSQLYGFHCATGIQGLVTVTVNGPVTYGGIIPGARTPVINGNAYQYPIGNYGLLDLDHDLGLRFMTNTTAVAGDLICFDVVVTPNTGDQNAANNTYHLCDTIVNSYDPNAKDVTPSIVLPGYADWLNYTIHFQNTGNAPAIDIRLEDTLDANLDWATLEALTASHFQTWSLVGNRLTVLFPNIMLPDSTTDPAGSMGYFMFRVKPKAGLGDGTTVPNRASIYFDYNAPVVTNTANTTFTILAGTSATEPDRLSVYPNPSQGIYQIDFPASWEQAAWSVTNLMGQELLHQTAVGGHFEIDLSGQPAGFYLLRVGDGHTQAVRQLVKR